MDTEWARQEMAGARLWDGRCVRSVVSAVRQLARNAGKSWSAALGSLRQAAGDICGDPSTTSDHLLHGHIEQTVERCRQHELVLVDQDTTDLNYSSHRKVEGMGPINTSAETLGYFLHSLFALSTKGVPLGLLGAITWVRDRESHGQKLARRKQATAEKESGKWQQGLEIVAKVLPSSVRALLIQDREGDVYDFIAAQRPAHIDLLIRVNGRRRAVIPAGVLGPKARSGNLVDLIKDAPQVGRMTVQVPRQPGQKKREATLVVQCIRMELRKPLNRADLPIVRQKATVVRAMEEGAPEGVEPLEWILLTTMEVEGAEDACRMVYYYALRWRVERFHFTLKSGCRIERLQMDNRHSLENAMAVYAVVAWRLMYLAYQAREEPERAATLEFSDVELTVLGQMTSRQVGTLRDAVRAVAVLGGFEAYPSAGEPGLKSLWMGLRELEAAVRAWQLALALAARATGIDCQESVQSFVTQG